MSDKTTIENKPDEFFFYSLKTRAFIRLRDKFRFGRTIGDLIIKDDHLLSKVHCEIQYTNEYIFLTDLESTNGTKVNGEKIQKQRLNHNDIITIGKNHYIFSTSSDLTKIYTPEYLQIKQDAITRETIKMFFTQPLQLKSYSLDIIIYTLLMLLLFLLLIFITYPATITQGLYYGPTFAFLIIGTTLLFSFYLSLVAFFSTVHGLIYLFVKTPVVRITIKLLFLFIICPFIMMTSILSSFILFTDFNDRAIVNRIVLHCDKKFHLVECSESIKYLQTDFIPFSQQYSDEVFNRFNIKLKRYIANDKSMELKTKNNFTNYQKTSIIYKKNKESKRFKSIGTKIFKTLNYLKKVKRKSFKKSKKRN